MAIVKKDGHGVYKVEEFWWFRHYARDCQPIGPYETRERAMEDLLEGLGFDVADADLAAAPGGPTLNEEARNQPRFDNPRDPFASPDRLPHAATPPSGSAVAMRDDLKKTINGALRIFFADDRAPTKSELYLIEKATEHLVAALAAPQAQDEPNHEGIDFALEQLCTFLGVDPHMVSWDAATETVDGDVQAVIGNIMRTKYGEDFDAKASVAATPAQDVRQILHDHFYTGEPGQHEAIEAALIRLAGSVATVRRHEAKERAYQAARDNLREAWAAISMIRETIETLAPSGAVKAAEHLDGPTFMHEADALVAGILAMVSRPLQAPPDGRTMDEAAAENFGLTIDDLGDDDE